MKSTTKFTAVTKEQLETLSAQLKGVVSDENLVFFDQYVKPYEAFGYNQLDDIFLIAEVTLKGNGTIKSLTPNCCIDQENWSMYYDEPDIQIDPVYIPMKTLVPTLPLEVEGTTTFLVVVEAEGNIWDSCKDLPEWIWNEHKFEFMLSFTLTTEDGKEHDGVYASKLIKW